MLGFPRAPRARGKEKENRGYSIYNSSNQNGDGLLIKIIIRPRPKVVGRLCYKSAENFKRFSETIGQLSNFTSPRGSRKAPATGVLYLFMLVLPFGISQLPIPQWLRHWGMATSIYY